MAVAAKPVGTLAEHSRMDYPFAAWIHMFRRNLDLDPRRFHLQGRVLQYMGDGKNMSVRPESGSVHANSRIP